jgi:3',5'-cyclic AMP phosphodiesterase CpdA
MAELFAAPVTPSTASANVNGQPLSFIVLGDMHFAKTEHYDAASLNDYSKRVCNQTEDTFEALWDEVELQLRAQTPRPSFVLLLGDYVHGDCPTEEKSQQHYADFVQSISRRNLPVPLFLTRGNHELQGKGVRKAYESHIPAFLRNSAPPSGGNPYYSFDAGPAVHFVILDVYGAGGPEQLVPEQLAWLEADMAAFRHRSPGGSLLVATHAPHFPITPRGFVFRSNPAAHANLTASFVKHRVNAILCGHIHDYSILNYTDPASGHVITQMMAWSMTTKEPIQAKPAAIRDYSPSIIEDVAYRKPEELAAMRQIASQVAPQISNYKRAHVPGYQIVNVRTDGSVGVTSYQGLGRNVYETISLPTGATTGASTVHR